MRAFLMFAFLFGFSFCFASEENPTPATHLEVPVYEDALDIAADQDRKLYLVFKGEGCVWCERQDKEMLTPLATEAMDGLVVCFVDIAERKDLAVKYGVRAIPAHRFVDSNGKVLRSATGYMEATRIKRFLSH